MREINNDVHVYDIYADVLINVSVETSAPQNTHVQLDGHNDEDINQGARGEVYIFRVRQEIENSSIVAQFCCLAAKIRWHLSQVVIFLRNGICCTRYTKRFPGNHAKYRVIRKKANDTRTRQRLHQKEKTKY